MSINTIAREQLEMKYKKQLDEYLAPLHLNGYDVLGTFKRSNPKIPNRYYFYLTSIDENTMQFKSYYFTSRIYTLFKIGHKQPKRCGIVYYKGGWIEMDFKVYSQRQIANLFKYSIMRCSSLDFRDRVHINFLDGE